MLKIDENIFNHNLVLTQRYCAAQSENRQMSVAEIFRSFNPNVHGQSLFSFQDGRSSSQIENNSAPWMMTKWAFDPVEQKPAVSIEKLFEDQISFKEQCQYNQGYAEFFGDILVAQIDGTVCDGASEHESLGLVDLYDMPPIDTWFYLTKSNEGRLLFCWIPDSVKQYAVNAVEVNCVACLYWFVSSECEAESNQIVTVTPKSQGLSFFLKKLHKFFVKKIFAKTLIVARR